jgi:hypothetical protein
MLSYLFSPVNVSLLLASALNVALIFASATVVHVLPTASYAFAHILSTPSLSSTGLSVPGF